MMDLRTRASLIVLEGLDGSGKTTCAPQLARALGAVCMTTPSPEIRDCRQHVLDSYRGSQEAAQLFYLASVFDASAKVRALLAAGSSVVMDRYFLSTQVYAQFRGSRLLLDAIESELVPASLTVFLDVPRAVRRRRLNARHCDAADRETLSETADARLRSLYAEKSRLGVAGDWLELACGAHTPDEIVSRIVQALRAPGRL